MSLNASNAGTRADERDSGLRSSDRFWLLHWIGGSTGRRVIMFISTLLLVRLMFLYLSSRESGGDFLIFYTAGSIFASGDALAVFDAVVGFRSPIGTADLRWLYPAHAVFLVMPLSLVSLETAYIAHGLVTWSVFAVGAVAFLKVLVPSAPVGLHLMLVAGPACFWPQLMGHPSLLWYGVLLAALALRERQYSVLAGVLIGVLTYKFTLGPLVAVALIAARDWRAVAAATLSALTLIALGTAYVGVEYWSLLWSALTAHADSLADAERGFDYDFRLVGLQGLINSFSGAPVLAPTMHVALGIACIAAVAWMWSDGSVPPIVRIAVLMALIPIAVPGIWFYDAVGLSIAAVLFVAGGAVPATSLGVVVLSLLYWNAMLTLTFSLPVGLVALPGAAGAVWLAFRARKF